MSKNRPPSRHYGAILSSQKVAELTVTENVYAPLVRLPEHSHQQSCFCLVLHGGYTEIYRRKTLTCQPFSIVFRPAGEVHSDHFGNARVRCFLIEFERNWLDRVSRYVAALDGPRAFRQHSIAWLAMRLRKEINQRDAVTPLIIEGLMLEMLAETSRICVNSASSARRRNPAWLARAGEIIRGRLSERLTLSDLARDVGVHPVYLAYTFRLHNGCTVGEYVRRLRVELACRELTKDDARLAQVAQAAGFSDQSQFSRTFKRVVGLTPTEYRKTLSPTRHG
jgi:AraC family transcriptional regulator